MHFVIDESMPRAVGALLKKHGHNFTDVRDVGLAGSSDAIVFDLATREHAALVTRDFDFADVRAYPPDQVLCIVVVAAPPDATREIVLKMFESLLSDSHAMSLLIGRLVIVEPARLRLRPPA